MHKKILCMILCLFMCAGCSSEEEYPSEYPSSPSFTESDVIYPEESGNKVLSGKDAIIDYSNTDKGYFMAKLTGKTDKKVKLKVLTDKGKYYYDLESSSMMTFPLQMGNGKYTVSILENTEGNNYATDKLVTIDVQLDNELLPFLYPNQLVYYDLTSKVVPLAFETVKNDDNDLKRIKSIYEYVVNNITYDDQKAVAATQKYIIPQLNELLELKSGICFDYASLMVAMLRLNHIPARLICGDTDVEYHAWVEVYLDGQGWVNPDIFVDKDTWTLMDPTFASSKFDYDGKYEAIYYY